MIDKFYIMLYDNGKINDLKILHTHEFVVLKYSFIILLLFV